MSRTTYHLSLDVQGFLLHAKPRDYRGMFKHDDGRPMSPDEAKAELLAELSHGRLKLPYGPCEGFDYVKGCPGHPQPEPSTEAQRC